MEKRLFITEAHDLIALIDDNYQNSNMDLTETVTNDWVNIVLQESKSMSVHPTKKLLDSAELYCLLSARDIKLFIKTLHHMIEPFDLGELGYPTLHHRVSDGRLEFYTLRG